MINVYQLPGLDGTGKLFEVFQAARPDWANPIAISYEREANNSYKALTEYVESQINPNEKCLVVGESFSGPIAVQVASRNQETVSRVILSASFVRSPSLISRIPVPGAILQVAVAMAPHGILAETLLLNGCAPGRLLQDIVTVTESVPPAVIAERIGEVQAIDVSQEMASLECPVLYLRGTEDRVVPPTAAEQVHSLNHRVEIRDIAAPHMVLQCEANEAWNAITEHYEKYS